MSPTFTWPASTPAGSGSCTSTCTASTACRSSSISASTIARRRRRDGRRVGRRGRARSSRPSTSRCGSRRVPPMRPTTTRSTVSMHGAGWRRPCRRASTRAVAGAGSRPDAACSPSTPRPRSSASRSATAATCGARSASRRSSPRRAARARDPVPLDGTGVELDQLAAIAVGIGPGLFTGLRVGVTTAKVMAQALRIPVVGVPSLDLVAWPLRHSSRAVVAVLDARRHEVFHASYRPVPGGVQRDRRLRGRDAGRSRRRPRGRGRRGAPRGRRRRAHTRELRRARARPSSAGPEFAAPASAALVELGDARGSSARSSRPPWEVEPLYLRASDAESRTGADGAGVTIVATADGARDPDAAPPRARRCCASRSRSTRGRGACRCSCRELALRTTRAYFVARVGRDVVGYAGLMMTAEDGHVTTIAVDPKWHRHKIGTRLLLALAREAIARDAREPDPRGPAVEQGRAGPVPAVRLRSGRRAQGLLPGDERGRARHVGPRGRHARVRRAARTASRPASRARPSSRNRWRRMSARTGIVRILGIETSCDETAAAVVEDGRRVAVVGRVEPGRPARALRRRRARRSRAGPTSS